MASWLENAVDGVRERLHRLEEFVSCDLLAGWNPSKMPSLHGKVALVTGGNSGLGYETVKKFAENGAKVFLVSRDHKNGEQAADQIRQEVGKTAQLEVLECDLSTLKNVVELIHKVHKSTNRLDILVNMAGVFHPGPFAKTEDNFEQTLAIDYWAPALLTLGLLPLLRRTPGARVIMMASEAEQFAKFDPDNLDGSKFTDSGLQPYSAAKLYLIMFARELAGRVPDIDVFCVHPGVSLTPLQYKASWRYYTAVLITLQARVLGLPPHIGAYSTLYAATEPSLTGKHFGYFGPSYTLNLFQTWERQPANRAAHSVWSCWRVFEQTVQTLRAHVGEELLKHVPKHPDDHDHKPSRAAKAIHSSPLQPPIAA